MFDPASAFDTYLTLDPALTQSELEAEIARLVRRQKAIAGLLDGTVPVDVVEEMLFEDQIDPYEWAEVAEQNLIYLLQSC
ncbi:hypothetical protein HJG54_35275 (plasmid) [Leptolyngbya sp. NK1-12]|uniref:Uncharacterized protein n=1 Tax=Leptolyngbya sp. NK1-12 TaxID=2547451 RepID=A0AA96WLT1_9CYAN|nr:hypothetical protein [Leptolyngbya sp. NK1-12]WNZ28177.1 hypothetical protein HJG54_35275 [Leptolyngbya sp. NK1-12]